MTIKGHAGTVCDLQLSRDESRLLSAGKDGTVRFWDAKTGNCLQVLSGHKGTVRAARLSEDLRLCSAGADRMLRLWELEAAAASACRSIRMVGGPLAFGRATRSRGSGW